MLLKKVCPHIPSFLNKIKTQPQLQVMAFYKKGWAHYKEISVLMPYWYTLNADKQYYSKGSISVTISGIFLRPHLF